MADFETGFNIEIGAIANKEDAKKASQDLEKAILQQFKDGRITIPAEVGTDFKKNGAASDKLKKAQSEFIKQWSKMSAEGFNSSEKDLNDLIEKYNEFNKLLKSDNQKRSRQGRALSESNFGDIAQLYSTQMKKIKAKENELAGIRAKAQTKNNSKLTKKEIQARKVQQRKELQEEIDAQIKAEDVRQKKRKDRLAREAEQAAKQVAGDYKSSSMDNPYATEEQLKYTNRAGPYRAGDAAGQAKTPEEMRKLRNTKVNVTIDKNAAKEEVEKTVANNKSPLTEQEINKEYAELIRNLAAKELGGIEARKT